MYGTKPKIFSNPEGVKCLNRATFCRDIQHLRRWETVFIAARPALRDGYSHSIPSGLFKIRFYLFCVP